MSEPSKPCTKTTWCTLDEDHEGSCIEVERKPIEPTDFGPRYKRKPIASRSS